MASRRRFLSTLTSKIEIERKFHPRRPLFYALTRTKAVPALPRSIAGVHPAAVQFIRDVYYDSPDDRLSAGGLWVRRRSVFSSTSTSTPTSSSTTCTSSSSWEAKVRVGGDFAASQFVEVEGAAAIERELRRVLGSGRVAVALDTIGEHLGVMCDLTTRRLAGRLELRDNDAIGMQNLTVAIDQVIETTRGDFAASRAVLEEMPVGRGANLTNASQDVFFHEIGELELMEEVHTEPHPLIILLPDPLEYQRHQHEARREYIAGARAAQLDTFMREHAALFPMTPRPRGKLEAYFAWKKERAAR
ncbi:hypothetical protein B0H11DRAFT_2188888 [Mycena galericulata]|nr:hypothetical protein B0H11DRAFT_2188888 [Mycena galericulata]